jgi:hypothetical protein
MLAGARRVSGASYWKRLWIIQEVVLASKIVVYDGFSQVPWENIARVLDMIRTSAEFKFGLRASSFGKEITESPMSLLYSFKSLKAFGEINTEDENRTILDLLKRYRHSLCLDSRDRVFGLLSIAKQCCQRALPVDYSMSGYDLAGKVVEHSISEQKLSRLSESLLVHHLIQCPNQNSHRYTSAGSPLNQFVPQSDVLQCVKGHIRGSIVVLNQSLSDMASKPSFRMFVSYEAPIPYILDHQINYHFFNKGLEGSQLRGLGNMRYPPSLPTLIESSSYADTRTYGEILRSSQNMLGSGRSGLDSEEESATEFVDKINKLSNRVLEQAMSSRKEVHTAPVHCKLAFEENGMICYVPIETELGDLICQFPSCDVASVVRKDERKGKYKVVGRAVHVAYGAEPPHSEPFWAGLFEGERYEGGFVFRGREYIGRDFDMAYREIDFHLNIPTIQALTHALPG